MLHSGRQKAFKVLFGVTTGVEMNQLKLAR